MAQIECSHCGLKKPAGTPCPRCSHPIEPKRVEIKGLSLGLFLIVALGSGLKVWKAVRHGFDFAQPVVARRWKSKDVLQIQVKDPSALERTLDDGVFVELKGVYPSVMDVLTAPDGSVWVVTKYGVHRFDLRAAGSFATLMDPVSHRKIFGKDLAAFACAHFSVDGALWLGGWHGTALRYHDGRWTEVLRREDPPKGKVAEIASFGNEVVFAAGGLWGWDSNMSRLVRDPEMRESLHSVAFDSRGNLYAAGAQKVFVRRDGSWSVFWRMPKGDERITAVSVRPNGNIFAATLNGFVVLDGRGEEVSRELPGRWITSFAQLGDGPLWAASWRSGIYCNAGPGWKRYGPGEGLAGESVSALHLGPNGRVWAGVYGKGLWLARRDKVVKFFGPPDTVER
ncbi:MAG: hypothetical protein ABIJ96_18370 [Elusimicrobiota bacterium]